MKNHKCKTEGCETTMSDGTPELCPQCQDDMETRYAALLLHTQTVVDENTRMREALEPFAKAADKADESSDQQKRLLGVEMSDTASPGWGIQRKHVKKAREVYLSNAPHH